MLAHVAAFIVDARVVHADRPVRDKFLRLYSRASLQDLDAAVGAQVDSLHRLMVPLEYCLLPLLAVCYLATDAVPSTLMNPTFRPDQDICITAGI